VIFFIHLMSFLKGFFQLAITTVKTTPDPISGAEQAGALLPNGQMIQVLGALQQNASPVFGNWSATIVPASLSATTYNANQFVGGLIKRFSTGAATTDSTDTATNIINAIPGAKVNQTFPVLVGNLGSGALTVAAGTGVTIVGSNVVSSNSIRLFLGQVTGSAAVTLTGIFQFGGPATVSPL
jgi:hypothetical protein